jgi:hypothetical protein
MPARTQTRSRSGMRQRLFALLVVGVMLSPRMPDAQGLTGALVGTVKDEHGECFQAHWSASGPWR